MNNNLINITDLSIGYKAKKQNTTVASSLNAEMYPGELICLLGSNGHGKSTLMRSICGFLPTLNGHISIKGKSLSEYKEKELANIISVVLTDRILIPQATVFEMVGLGRSPHTGLLGKLSSEDKKIVQNSLEICQIDHKANDFISNLSDGERQKANIARALAQDTPIIILDEPTAFLDLPSSVEIMLLLRKLASEKNKAILMSTHNLDLALQMADKLWLLEKDGPLISGSPEDLLLTRAFQKMFDSNNIKFDPKTGLFKVSYSGTKTIQVNGHGFRYVLLRRALARKGIQTEACKKNDSFWVQIPKDENSPMRLLFDNELVGEFNKMEDFVKFICTTTEKQNHFIQEQYEGIILNSSTQE